MGSLRCNISIWLMPGLGQKPALPHRNMGVCFDLQQRTLSIVFSVAP
jgi:hypothetical protein